MNIKKLSESSIPGLLNTGSPKGTTKPKIQPWTTSKPRPKTILDTEKQQEPKIGSKKYGMPKLPPLSEGLCLVLASSLRSMALSQAALEDTVSSAKRGLGVGFPDAKRKIVMECVPKRAAAVARMLQGKSEDQFERHQMGRNGTWSVWTPAGIDAIANLLKGGVAIVFAIDSGSAGPTETLEFMVELDRMATESGSWVCVFMLKGTHNSDMLAHRFEVFDVDDCEPDPDFAGAARIRLAGVSDLWAKGTVDVICNVKAVRRRLEYGMKPFTGATQLERALYRLYCEGNSMAAIAKMAGINKSTVSRQLKSLPPRIKPDWDENWLTDELREELGWHPQEEEKEDSFGD